MYRAKDTFWAPDNRRIVKGDLVAPHDPVLDGREGLFEEVVIPTAIAPASKPATAKTAARKTAASKPTAKDAATATQDPADEKQADGGDQE